jgi:hypothetical protein
MTGERIVPRPSWSLVLLLMAIAALAASALIVRNAPQTTTETPLQLLASGVTGVHVVDRVKLGVGESTTLFKNDGFRVVATCIDEGAGVYTASYGVRALESNTLVFSTDDSNETDTRLDPDDGLYRWSSYEASSDAPLYYGYDYYQEFTGESRGGDLLIGRVSSGVYMRGADCIYNGLFVG